ncbi:MAG: hypothetical protein GX224_01540 [Thermoplasmatales archaeon]|nr:hypothetical protein [Thermoplasmatales archaeon]
MGRKMRFRGVKHTPKRLEEDLLAKAKELWEDPSVLRPKCAGDCRKCHFDKTFKRIAAMDRIKDDEAALLKMASRGGDDIAKAYAATISLHAAQSIPYLATAKLGGEEVSFAQRGAVRNDKLIGCQYYDDPKMRLLLYNTLASKKKLRMYSFGDEIVCSDRPNMPAEYLADALAEAPYDFLGDGLSCGHGSGGMLKIKIKSLGKEVSICEACAKEVSTVPYIISRHFAKDPLEDIEVRVEHSFHSEGQESFEIISGDVLKKYANGQLTDSGLIRTVLKDKAEYLKGGGVATYVIGNENLGSDLGAFLARLRGTDIETRALEGFLRETGRPVVIKSDRASEALGLFWKDDYRSLLEVVSDAETAAAMGDVSKRVPADALREAHSTHISKDVVKSLPDFGKRAGPFTVMADSLAKAYKVGGLDFLLDEVEASTKRDWKYRALAHAFTLAAGGEDEHHRLKADEVEFAMFLVPFSKQLLDSSGDAYRENMNTLLTALGSGEKV